MEKTSKQKVAGKNTPLPQRGNEKTQAPTMMASDARDATMYASAKKSYILATVFTIMTAWSSAKFAPFNYVYTSNDVAGQLLSGGLAAAGLVFLLFAYGNALEIRGNVLEWKYIFLCIIIMVLVSAWGGFLTFIILIVAVFIVLGYMWSVNK
nr:hypothetical protein [Candidatus Sigynarchaeota archaeon]